MCLTAVADLIKLYLEFSEIWLVNVDLALHRLKLTMLPIESDI